MSDIIAGPYRSPFAGLRPSLNRNRRAMLMAFIGCTALSGTVALIMPPQYKAESVLMVRLGPEYLINGDPASTAMFPERMEIVASEAAMMQTPQLAREVIESVGLARIYPSLAAGIDASDADSAKDAMERAVLRFGKSLTVLPVKETTLFDVTFKNRDPDVAAQVLQATVDGYLRNRRRHFEYGAGVALDSQVQQTVSALQKATEAVQQVKTRYGITDIDHQSVSLFGELDDLTRDANAARLDIAAQQAQIRVLAPLAEARKTAVLQTIARSGPTILAVRDEAAKLRLQENALSLQFKHATPQMEDIHHHIDMTESLLRLYANDRDIETATGRSKEYDAVATALDVAEAQEAASTAKLDHATQGLATVSAAIARLDSGRALYDQKSLELKTAEDAYAQAAKRVNESRAHDQMMDAAKPNVEVVQAAVPPYKETPLRLIIAGAGALLGLLMSATILYLDDIGRGWRPE
jgi:uncharacterized protein involved in exopolysaccharide biosynthesis